MIVEEKREVNAPCDSSQPFRSLTGESISWTDNRALQQTGIERQSVNWCNSSRDERESWRKFKLELKTEQKKWWTANIDWIYLVPHSTCTPRGWFPHFHKSLGLYLLTRGKKGAAPSGEHIAWRILHHAVIPPTLLCGHQADPLAAKGRANNHMQ